MPYVTCDDCAFWRSYEELYPREDPEVRGRLGECRRHAPRPWYGDEVSPASTPRDYGCGDGERRKP